jgi:putative solute:sodium symporter small subunit
MSDPESPTGGSDDRPATAEHSTPVERPSVTDPATVARHAEYWRRNIRYVGSLLVVWFVVSYGFGIVLAEQLNAFTLPGTNYPLGFWFAQQGAIYVFVILIFVYVRLMNGLDREFDVDEGADA